MKNLVLEALLRRLIPNHPKRSKIKEELIRRKAGYIGERSLDYYKRQFPYLGHYIFQDLRLPLSNNACFQIDSLLLSNRYSIIYDAKHHSGTLVFEEQQMLRTYDSLEEAFPNPIIQAENQQYHLENLIRKYFNITLPSTSFIVITNPSTIIRYDSHYEQIASKRVIRPTVVRQKSDLFWQKHQKELISKSELQRLCQLLLKLDTPLKPNVLEEFNIGADDILTGVRCSICQSFTVSRQYGSWVCKKCRNADKNAHIPALIDYFLLVGDSITNRQIRTFLHLPSISIASKILASLQLPFEGSFKNRVYFLSLDKLEKWL